MSDDHDDRKTYEFTIFIDADDERMSIVYRLRDVGVRDAILDWTNGETKLLFRRKARGQNQALASGIASVLNAGCTIQKTQFGWACNPFKGE